jgi:hypothetical protein
MPKLSPILVSVYNRFEHFKKSIEALKLNSLANESILYIVSDGAARQEDIAIVNTIRDFCHDITGFYEVKFIFRDKNLGSHKCVVSAMTSVVQKHGKIIFLEDDIIVSEDFLEYMNKGLNTYEDDKRIFSISGYNIPSVPPKSYKNDVYLWSRYNAWGMATWLDRWSEIDWELKAYNNFITDKKQVEKFDKIARSTMPMLKADRDGKITAADVRISFDMFINNLYTVYPVKSKVRNIGFDGSGEHCGAESTLQDQIIDVGEVVFPLDLKLNSEIYRWRSHYHLNIKGQIIKPMVLKIFPFLRKHYE